ncbi:MAG: amidophosphoribosyltransferase [Verrucomicrobiota bacterium]
MSDSIKHECGIVMIRLKKPLSYFQEKYGSPLWGFNKLFLLMEKQHNRGQDGAGIGCTKIGMPVGEQIMFRERSSDRNALSKIFNFQLKRYEDMVSSGDIHPEFAKTVKLNFDFGGELLLGHLRYATSGDTEERACHPYYRRSNWPTRTMMLAGNFTMTNTNELHERLAARGQHPVFDTDTRVVLEEIGYFLDEAHNEQYKKCVAAGQKGSGIYDTISRELDPAEIARKAAAYWDGGYVLSGIIGNGDAFVMRDARGIRPCYYTEDDELIAFASERVPLLTALDKRVGEIHELEPGTITVIKSDGSVKNERFAPEAQRSACSFERIYFSRGNDVNIYRERKALGAALSDQILWAINHDVDHAIFTYIPNTAEMAYFGLMGKLHSMNRELAGRRLVEELKAGTLTEGRIADILGNTGPRGEKIAIKDIKLRTFISEESGRAQLVSHVYDIAYGVVKPEDTLVCIDDSIVRGTTLKESILKMLSRTEPRKIVIASTAPQIRYPDCYGIDMSQLGKFIAFQAAIALHKEKGSEETVLDVYQDCLDQAGKEPSELVNHVKRIYDPFTDSQISKKISELVRPSDISWKGEVEIIFQSVENLHQSCPRHTGDWYFTGDYPTPGGYAVLNQAFINYYENRSGRSY